MNSIDEILEHARRVLVICLGNTCRSPAAEGLLRKFAKDYFPDAIFKELVIESAGLNSHFTTAQPGSIKWVKALEGEDISSHESREVTREMLQLADLVLVMEYSMKGRLLSLAPTMKGLGDKIFGFKDPCMEELGVTHPDVLDPFMRGDEVYRKVVTEIRDHAKCIACKWSRRLKV